MNHYRLIYQAVQRIPKGRVATYGQIAMLAGLPRHARQVGYALAALSGQDAVPWYRVVNVKGEISQRADPDGGRFQRVLLEQEGVVFDSRDRIPMHKYQWRPKS